jgi:hypothetical protein
MTIKYALTRAEIVRFFLQGLRKSPRLLAIVLICSLWPGLFSLATEGAFSRPLTASDAKVAFVWTIGAFCFFLLLIFVRGKTAERTLSVSEQGISTEIGSIKGQVPWSKVKVVSDTGRYVLIARTNGNAFFIPRRAFSGPEQQLQFMTEISHWRKS